jgi:hypothetical protein
LPVKKKNNSDKRDLLYNEDIEIYMETLFDKLRKIEEKKDYET